MDAFKDNVVLIIGGSFDLGGATMLRLARDGAGAIVGARPAELR